MAGITLIPLAPEDQEQIISKYTIKQSIYSGEAYRILEKGRPVGGVIIQVDGERGDLDLFEKRMDSSYKTDPLPQRLDK